MSDRLGSGKGMISTNRPKNTGCLRRGESGSVVSCVGYDAMHQDATSGFGQLRSVGDLERRLVSRRSWLAVGYEKHSHF
jgi:hypothetical protein